MLVWKVGDWAIYNLEIIQIKEIRENDIAIISDGCFETSGRLLDRLRPLTLRNKHIIERLEYYYKELNKIDGERGFNYPDISRHFSNLAIKAIDGSDDVYREVMSLAASFIREANEYTKEIQGVKLFRKTI